MTNDELDALLERALQFQMLELPGQPMAMHMGTSYLVRDMERAITALRADLAAARALLLEARGWLDPWESRQSALRDSIDAALAGEKK
jgi:hypothetical protein